MLRYGVEWGRVGLVWDDLLRAQHICPSFSGQLLRSITQY
jgi:hypothetical protein